VLLASSGHPVLFYTTVGGYKFFNRPVTGQLGNKGAGCAFVDLKEFIKQSLDHLQLKFCASSTEPLPL